MKIISDRLLSRINEETGYMEHKCGALDYRDINLEDHLVTLDNGISLHVGCEHGKQITIDMIIKQLAYLSNNINNYRDF